MLRARFDSIRATIGFDASLDEIRVALLVLALIDKGNAIKIKVTIIYQVYASEFLPRVTFNRAEASVKEMERSAFPLKSSEQAFSAKDSDEIIQKVLC